MGGRSVQTLEEFDMLTCRPKPCRLLGTGREYRPVAAGPPKSSYDSRNAIDQRREPLEIRQHLGLVTKAAPGRFPDGKLGVSRHTAGGAHRQDRGLPVGAGGADIERERRHPKTEGFTYHAGEPREFRLVEADTSTRKQTSRHRKTQQSSPGGPGAIEIERSQTRSCICGEDPEGPAAVCPDFEGGSACGLASLERRKEPESALQLPVSRVGDLRYPPRPRMAGMRNVVVARCAAVQL